MLDEGHLRVAAQRAHEHWLPTRNHAYARAALALAALVPPGKSGSAAERAEVRGSAMPPQLEQEERRQVAALGLRAAAPQRLKKARAPFVCAAAWHETFEQQVCHTDVSGDATAPHATRAVHHDTPTGAPRGGAPVHATLEPRGARLGACGVRRRVLLHRKHRTECRWLRRDGERVCHACCGERGVVGY